MKKALVIILLLALTVSLFTGCGKDFLTADEAQKKRRFRGSPSCAFYYYCAAAMLEASSIAS